MNILEKIGEFTQGIIEFFVGMFSFVGEFNDFLQELFPFVPEYVFLAFEVVFFLGLGYLIYKLFRG